jgi:hypoxanthine-guanine phosphoribosyltransferase
LVVTPEYTRSSASAPFVLLEDFWHAYDVFPLKAVGINDRLLETVVEPMRAALAAAVPSLVIKSDDEIGHQIDDVDWDSSFVITMDGGTYFRRADFSFEITRATHRFDRAGASRFLRLSRDGRPLLVQQGIQLHTRYERQGKAKPIVLCDDGIGTGHSVARVLETLSELHLDVQRIYVLINPRGIEDVRGVEVVTLLDTPLDVLWLSERDLYWGIPRSGVSLTPVDVMRTTWGIPYTADVDLVEARIGLRGDHAAQFRRRCLELNATFWHLLEEHHRRSLCFEDCVRIEFFASQLGLRARPIVDVLHEIRGDDFRLETLAARAAASS